jgi:hypothetical protein
MGFYRPGPAAARRTAFVAIMLLIFLPALMLTRWVERALGVANGWVDAIVWAALWLAAWPVATRAGAYAQRRVMDNPS